MLAMATLERRLCFHSPVTLLPMRNSRLFARGATQSVALERKNVY